MLIPYLLGLVQVVVDIGEYWPRDEDGNELSINYAYEQLIRQDRRVDRRTLTAAKSGNLSRCDLTTLVNLRDFCSDVTRRPLQIEDLLRVKP